MVRRPYWKIGDTVYLAGESFRGIGTVMEEEENRLPFTRASYFAVRWRENPLRFDPGLFDWHRYDRLRKWRMYNSLGEYDD